MYIGEKLFLFFDSFLCFSSLLLACRQDSLGFLACRFLADTFLVDKLLRKLDDLVVHVRIDLFECIDSIGQVAVIHRQVGVDLVLLALLLTFDHTSIFVDVDARMENVLVKRGELDVL